MDEYKTDQAESVYSDSIQENPVPNYDYNMPQERPKPAASLLETQSYYGAYAQNAQSIPTGYDRQPGAFLNNPDPYAPRAAADAGDPRNSNNAYPVYPANNPYTPYGTYAPYPVSPKAKKSNGITWKGVVAIIVACALVFTSLGFGASWAFNNAKNLRSSTGGSDPHSGQSSNADSRDEELSNSDPLQVLHARAEDGALTIAEIAAKTQDSVVEITTESVVTGTMLQQYIETGAGSGVIITADGYIITNYHVVGDASKISVTLHNGETYSADIIGLDEQLDLALIKVDQTDLIPAVLDTSSNLVVGQTVVAVGNPLGQLGGSVSSGIISALDRNINIEGQSMTLLQIDAAVNPGNSGGGLFNAQGNLIGIVNAKSTGTNVEGIGFAIPIDSVTAVLDDLKTHGYVTGRVRIGIGMVDILSEQAAWMYRVNELGVYLSQIEEGSAAQAGGLQVGDRLISINDVEIKSGSQAKALIQGVTVGDSLTFVVARGGINVTVQVTATEYIPKQHTQNSPQTSGKSDSFFSV